MTHPEIQPAATLTTERDVTAPYGVCDRCHHTPAVYSPIRDEYLCAACTPLAVLSDAAHEHLDTLVLPVLAAWAHHWQAAGLPREELTARLGLLVGDTQEDGTTDLLRSAMINHPVPDYTPAHSDRVTLHPADLPTLTGYTLTDPERGIPRPHFLDSEGQPHSLPLGLDSLTLPQPDGSALLIFTGYRGTTDLHPTPGFERGFRVVAGLLPMIQATLARSEAQKGA